MIFYLSQFNRVSLICGAALLTFIQGFSSEAFELPPPAHLNRCYSHVTGRRIPASHSLYRAVKSGQLTSEQACSELIDRVMLKASGMINDANSEIAIDSENALNFLNMQDNNKISGRDFCAALPDSGQYCDGQFDVYDANTPGLVLTEALLNPQKSYKEIFTFSRVPRAEREFAAETRWPQYSPYLFRVRNSTAGKAFWNDPGLVEAMLIPDLLINTTSLKINVIDINAPVNAYGFSNNLSQTLSSWAPRTSRIKAGSLKGIVFDPNWSLRFPATSNMDSFFKVNGLQAPAFDPRTTIDQDLGVNSNVGAGVFGTREYLMLNFGWGYNFTADGVIQTPRRWSQAVFKDFFCRPMPVIRASDALPYVISSPTYSQDDIAKAAPFRLASNCTACHTVMDQMAGVVRDITWHQPAFANDSSAPGATIQIVRRPSSLVVTTSDNTPWRNKITTGSETPFWKRAPIGRLMYRSYDGRLVKIDVQNLRDLAAQVADQNDPYVCAAKNYFKQFTGVDISLHDVGDPANSSINAGMTANDWNMRNFVISLGLELKRDGRASNIVKKILNSSYFKERKISSEEAE